MNNNQGMISDNEHSDGQILSAPITSPSGYVPSNSAYLLALMLFSSETEDEDSNRRKRGSSRSPEGPSRRQKVGRTDAASSLTHNPPSDSDESAGMTRAVKAEVLENMVS